MFHGSIVALVTPMLADGVIDVDGLRRLVEWHIEQGTDGIVVLGSTGEMPTINPAERNLVIQQTLQQAAGRVPIIAGTGTNSTDSTIHYTREAMELGVDACLLVTPYYNKPTQEGLYQHYKTIAEAVAIPQILYNVPSRTACDLKPTTVARLASFSNIIGLKDATGDLKRLTETRALLESSLDFFSGDDPSAAEFMLMGGRGIISITANVVPAQMHAICQAALRGDAAQVQTLNNPLAQLHEDLCIETNPIPVKWALHAMSLIDVGIRLPLTTLSALHQTLLRNSLEQAGVLV